MVDDESPSSDNKNITPTETANEEQAGILAVASASRYSGPIPPPDMFREYENILGGAADRILSLAEYNQKNNFDISKNILSNNRLNISLSFIISIAPFLASIVSIYFDQSPFLSGAFGFVGLVSLFGGRKATPQAHSSEADE